LFAETGKGKVPAQPGIHAKFRPQIENLADLCLQDITRKAVFRYAEMHHPAGHRSGLEHRNGIAQKSEIMCSGKSCRPRPDDRHLLFVTKLRFFRKNVDGMTRLRAVPLG
jgi:hypothetical protein